MAFALIKMEGLDDVGRARFTREAQSMGRLGSHPNVVAVLDIGEHEGQPWMVNELLGGDVEELIDGTDGGMDLERALKITADTLNGLQFAHEHSVVHRDIKPANIWLTDDGTAKVGDFGLATATDRPRLTQEKMIVGTVSYMPPEQATGGAITPQADLYSVGAMLYEMVTGRPPFMGDTDIAIIGQHINTPPVAPQWHRPEIPAQLDSLIMRLMSKNPAERPESAADALSALNAIDIRERPTVTPSPLGGEGGGEGSPASGNLDAMASGVFVGRHAEMDQLKARLESALSGRGGMVTLVGEPGIGKSRTSLELETYAGLRNAQVLWGRCYEGGGAPPYWPWVQAIRSYVTSRDPDDLRREMGSTASVISEIVDDVKQSLPEVQPPPHLDEPESARFRLFDSVATFLKNAGQVKPLILILDDLHWADGPSLKMLEFVARELASSRVLIIGTYRDMELNRRHPLSITLGELTRERLFERVLLRGLTHSDVGQFIELASGIKPPSALVDAVHTQTEGNPLFVTETVRLLIQEGDLTQERTADRDSWSVRIPEGVREVIGRRLDRLSERCNDVLTIASIIGRRFTLEQLRVTVEDTSENQLLDVIDEGLASRNIEELSGSVGEYQFTHALIQETLASELSTTRKVRMHARIGEAFEELYGDQVGDHAEQLALHFAEAETVVGSEKVFRYSRMAGDTAFASLGHEEAVSHYERALGTRAKDQLDDESAQVLLSLGRALSATARIEDAAKILRRAIGYFLEHDDIESASLELEDIHNVTLATYLLDFYPRVIERSPTDSARAADLLASYGLALAGKSSDFREARKPLDDALRIGTQLEDGKIIARALANLANIEGFHTRWDDAFTHATEALATPGLDQLSTTALRAALWASFAAYATGQPDVALSYATQCLEAAQKRRDRDWMLRASGCEFSIRAGIGDWDGAQIAFGRYASMPDAAPAALSRSYAAAAFIKLLTEDADVARGALNDVLPVSETGIVQAAPGFALLAAYHDFPDDYEAIRKRLDELELGLSHVRFFRRNSIDFARAILAIHENDVPIMTETYESLINQHQTMMSTGPVFVSGDHILGMLARGLGNIDDAVAHFEEAIEFCKTAGYRPDLGWTSFDYADLLLERNADGDREKVTELQDEAIAIATDLGMKPLLTRVLAQREILQA